MESYISHEVLWSLFVLSVAGFVASLIVIPFVLVRLPPQYFDVRYPRTWMKEHHPVLRWVGLILKNVVGVVFFLAGVAMLFLPGQGLLTMLIGLSLVDFPGKRRLESKLIGQAKVLKTINALRHKFGQPPLTVASDK